MTKSRFDEIKSTITKKRKNELKTIVDKREIALDNAEKLVEDMIN